MKTISNFFRRLSMKDVGVPIIAAVLGAAIPEACRWILVPKKPVANFEYYSPGTDKKYAVARTSVKFKNTSTDAKTVRWTFPSGNTYSEDSVEVPFVYSGLHTVKLEAFSEDGSLKDEKIIECRVISAVPENAATIKIKVKDSPGIFTSNPVLEIGPIKDHLPETSSFTISGVPKGNLNYFFTGNAAYHENNEVPHSCDIKGSGSITIVPNGTYLVSWKNAAECEMQIEQIP
jgi:hypothetical protein